jgi:hypothetical protein
MGPAVAATAWAHRGCEEARGVRLCLSCTPRDAAALPRSKADPWMGTDGFEPGNCLGIAGGLAG